MSPSQLSCIRSGLRGEERQYFTEKIIEIVTSIHHTPAIYQQDGLGENAIAFLHYFIGGMDWYITEKDPGAPEDEEIGILPSTQQQAYGLACAQSEELGYISVAELIANNVELDLHFTPCTLGEIKAIRMCRAV